ncbi:MAG: GntR family transcriptional regulator [Lachnospiraceae bacterium]|jgi:GntR family transcriptional regulator|nr:GntR family transcriptional regulator [Lachnospiraceae bacterium]
MIVLDYRDKRPIYEQVVEKLEHLIVCGALEANTKMPSVRSLALDLSVNPNTIQRAYAQLEQDGYLYTVVGRGNYVTGESEWKKGKVEQTLSQVRDALTGAHSLGIPKEDIMQVLSSIYDEDHSANQKEDSNDHNQ